MATQTLSNLVRELRLRATGIANHLETLGSVGVTQEDSDTGLAYATKLEMLDAEQEALKAQLKVKTAELNAVKKEARQWRSRVTKLIKIGLQNAQERWVEFGITTRR